MHQWLPPDWNEVEKKPTELTEEELEEKKLKEDVAQPFTADQLENIHQEAYNEGYEEGLEIGKKEGIKKGLEQGKTEGREQGYNIGLSEGKKTGEKAGWDESQSKITQIEKDFIALLDSFQKPLKNQEDEIKHAILQCVVAISESVLLKEIKDTKHLTYLISRLIADLPVSEQKNITAKVSIKDFAMINEYLSEIPSEWKIVKDDSIIDGNIKIETDNSLIEYCWQERLKKVLQSWNVEVNNSELIQQASEQEDK